MKKHIVTILTLICALASLVMASVGFLANSRAAEPQADAQPSAEAEALQTLTEQNQALTDSIQALTEQVDSLQNQLDSLRDRVDQILTVVALDSWELVTTPWANGIGADITLVATPTAYVEGVNAYFLVQLKSQPAANVPCSWNGTEFIATASLNAADGYGYYLVLTTPTESTQYPLNIPSNPNDEVTVNLATSLSAYCNLLVDSWSANGTESVTLISAYAQVQLPRLSIHGEAAIESSELVVLHNGTESARVPITLKRTDSEGNYELIITDTDFPLPALEEDDLLELQLEVNLTDGLQLMASGASWYRSSQGLFAVVG